MTEVTPDLIAGFRNKKSSVEKINSVSVSSEAKKSTNRDVRKISKYSKNVRKIDYRKIADSDSEKEDIGNKIKRMKLLFSSNCSIL